MKRSKTDKKLILLITVIILLAINTFYGNVNITVGYLLGLAVAWFLID